MAIVLAKLQRVCFVPDLSTRGAQLEEGLGAQRHAEPLGNDITSTRCGCVGVLEFLGTHVQQHTKATIKSTLTDDRLDIL